MLDYGKVLLWLKVRSVHESPHGKRFRLDAVGRWEHVLRGSDPAFVVIVRDVRPRDVAVPLSVLYLDRASLLDLYIRLRHAIVALNHLV